jgi:hypothetical protein
MSTLGSRTTQGTGFALRQVEDGEALEERDRLRFVAGLFGACIC